MIRAFETPCGRSSRANIFLEGRSEESVKWIDDSCLTLWSAINNHLILIQTAVDSNVAMSSWDSRSQCCFLPTTGCPVPVVIWSQCLTQEVNSLKLEGRSDRTEAYRPNALDSQIMDCDCRVLKIYFKK